MTDQRPPVVERPLFFLDYDGTLAPIVTRPEEAYPHPDVPALLATLQAQAPVWLVTGRHLRDLKPFLPELELQGIGLHGAQMGRLGGTLRSRISEEAARALAQLRAGVPEGDGVWVEDKEHMFAVHYREASDPEAARARLQQWIQDLPESLDPTWGKCVVELRPRGTTKGTAVQEVARRYPDRTPLYLGDDVTDEDAFEALGEGAVTIKVGDGPTKARYRLADVDAVVRYLKQYVQPA